MRKLNKYEYEIAISILISHLTKEKIYTELEETTSMNWTCASFSRVDEGLFENLLTFLEIPEEQRDSKTDEILYCRDWVWDIYFEDLKLDQSEISIPYQARLFLDKIISEYLEWGRTTWKTEDLISVIAEQYGKFKTKFGRQPLADDLIFFDMSDIPEQVPKFMYNLKGGDPHIKMDDCEKFKKNKLADTKTN